MTDAQKRHYDQQYRDAISERSTGELAVGFIRYEALRRLNPRQYAELHKRLLRGENFDGMVDELVGTP